MTSLWRRILSGAAWVELQPVEIDNFLEPVRINTDLLAKGVLQCNVFAGGCEINGVRADATGDAKLWNYAPLFFDNAADQFAGTAATFVARYRFYLRVSNVGITVTPKLWYAADEATLISGPTVATISGEAACSATSATYNGTNQIQVVTVTIPSGAKYWLAGFTIGGVPAAGYQAWARAYRDIYMS